jgi:nucleotide-binding universal stress UspA family protein
MFPMTILLATDGSAEAGRAAQIAVELSKSLGSELHVVHVAPVPSAYSVPESFICDPEFYERMRDFAGRESRVRLDEEVMKVRSMGEVAGAHARVGRPDVEILRLAELLDVGLIVVGSRGLGPIRRALMGSVSDSVVRHAHCPVLVVRNAARDEDIPVRKAERRARV